MAIKKRQLDPFNNDGAGLKARNVLPAYSKEELYGLQIRAVGDDDGSPATVEQLLSSIAFEMGDVEKITVNPRLHKALAAHLNVTGNTERDDTIFIDFASLATARSPIGTMNAGKLSVVAQIKEDAGTVTHDHLEALAHYRSLGKPAPVGPLYRQKKHVDTKVVKGWNYRTDFPIDDLAILSQILIDSPHILNVRCFIGDDKRIDAKREHVDGWQRHDPTKNAQGIDSVLILDFEDFNDAKEGYNLSEGAFKLEYEFDSAENVPAGGIEFLLRGIEV